MLEQMILDNIQLKQNVIEINPHYFWNLQGTNLALYLRNFHDVSFFALKIHLAIIGVLPLGNFLYLHVPHF